MQIQDIIRFLEEIFPSQYAEDFDNTGLLTGDENAELKGVLVAHDAIEPVIDEAVKKSCNLVVAFHPIIFNGLKSITGKNYVEKAVIKAIKNDIAIYSPHTAVDNHYKGVSFWTAQVLGLENIRILIPAGKTVKQLVTYVPEEHAEKVRLAMFKAGAGHIGEYEECSYNLEGYGTFKPSDSANPYVGEKGKRHIEPETRISVIFPKHLTGRVLQAMLEAHPYEEPAYEIFQIENKNPEIGLGIIGEFSEGMDKEDFLKLLKEKLQAPFIKHSDFQKEKVEKVAVLGGSGAFAIDAAKKAGADAFVSGDFKYHDFFKSEGKILLTDVGHFESERFVAEKLTEIISKKFPKFAIIKSETITNPVKYF